jgi:hypothetical protein
MILKQTLRISWKKLGLAADTIQRRLYIPRPDAERSGVLVAARPNHNVDRC